MGFSFDSAQGPPENLNHKFYFLLYEGCGSEDEGRKNQNFYIVETVKLSCACGSCCSNFFCAVNYLKNQTDWTIFFMTDFFMSKVAEFEI